MENLKFAILFVGSFIFLVFVAFKLHNSFLFYLPLSKFKDKWRSILVDNVDYYNQLQEYDKRKFEKRIQHFLWKYKIVAVDTILTDKDIILIAASGVIPIFGFNHWAYPNLNKIELYPDDIEGANGKVIYELQWDVLQRNQNLFVMMKFSRPALYSGFADFHDGENTGIHEFVHLMDLLNEKTNGVPDYLLERKYIIPWMHLIHREIQKINTGESDIREYAAKSPGEFFAVVAEYFFERPQDLAREHPELYRYMNEIFKQRL